MDKAEREKVLTIILDAVKRDRGVIAAEIGQRIKTELGIELSNKQINAYRKQMGINALSLIQEDFIKEVVRVVYKK